MEYDKKSIIFTFKINNTKLEEGFRKFVNKITINSNPLFEYDYIYINIWSMACMPCLTEMPFLDSLPTTLNKKIAFFFVSSHSDQAVESFLKRKNIEIKNFIFINEMIDFISSIYNELEEENQKFPLHVVFSKEGRFLAFLFGTISDKDSATPLINFVENLK